MTQLWAMDSGYWFLGQLAPAHACRFDVQEVEVASGSRVEVYADMLAIWALPGGVIRHRSQARELAALILGAYALLSKTALDWSELGWVEATRASFEGTVIGRRVDARGWPGLLAPSSPRNVTMRHAVELAGAVRERTGWRLALRDIHAAHRAVADESDDAFVYAYRAVEDIAHAVSTQPGKKDWSALHTLLGATEVNFRRRLGPLQDARDAAGHGDEDSQELASARLMRAQLVDRSRRIVLDAFRREGLLPP